MATDGLTNLQPLSKREKFFALFRPTLAEDSLHLRKKPTALLYDVDENPPILVKLGVSVQHLFLMSVGWLYVVVIVNSFGALRRKRRT